MIEHFTDIGKDVNRGNSAPMYKKKLMKKFLKKKKLVKENI